MVDVVTDLTNEQQHASHAELKSFKARWTNIQLANYISTQVFRVKDLRQICHPENHHAQHFDVNVKAQSRN